MTTTDRKTTAVQCVKIIVNVMCNRHFMNGWFGDVSQEYRDEQVAAFLNLTRKERELWIERNRFNLICYCKVPSWVLFAAAHLTDAEDGAL